MYEYPEMIDEEEVHVKYTAIEPASQPRKWIPWVVLCCGVLFLIIASILTALHFNRSSSVPETTILQLTEERDRLKQQLQLMDNHTAEGWVYFRGSLYLGSTSGRSWQQSREFCQERGADLIIITSTEEQDFARLTFCERRWIGLSELQEKGVWKWVDGSPLTTSFWRRGEPNDAGAAEECVEINYFTDAGSKDWNDTPCYRKQKCICEKKDRPN